MFHSGASNLVSGDTNGQPDVFVHDRQTGLTTRVSVDSSGSQANSFSGTPTISADGRYVAFTSNASNLIPGDTNSFFDVFVHDRNTGQTTRVSVDSTGVQGNSGSHYVAISGDGRYVAFESSANTLVPGDTNGHTDIFVHDRQTGTTSRASLDNNGNQLTYDTTNSSISDDGRFIVFNDTGFGSFEVFIRDRLNATTSVVSVNSNGQPGNGTSQFATISPDGRYVAFESSSTNLIPRDTNNASDVFVDDRQAGECLGKAATIVGTPGNDVHWNGRARRHPGVRWGRHDRWPGRE